MIIAWVWETVRGEEKSMCVCQVEREGERIRDIKRERVGRVR